MVPGLLPITPMASPIERLSPSQYGVLKSCVLRASWAAARQPALLPPTPSAKLGSVIHKLLEEAGRGALGDGDIERVREAWARIVTATEEKMNASWLERSLVPLSSTAKDYDVRRIRAERTAALLAAEASHFRHDMSSSGTVSPIEVWVATRDGRVGGFIDRVCETSDGPVLLDYKSGTVTERGSETVVIESYQVQLKLYAALYAETYGRWPAGLEIVPLDGPAQAIHFTPEECHALLAEATTTLTRANEAIARCRSASQHVNSLELIATPRSSTCKACPYRPVCTAYRGLQTENSPEWPLDIGGRVSAMQKLGNGRLALTVTTTGGMIGQIRSLSQTNDRHPALNMLRLGDHVAVYNLDERPPLHMFCESPLTVLYRYPDGESA